MNEVDINENSLDEICLIFGDIPNTIKFDENMYHTDLSYIASSF